MGQAKERGMAISPLHSLSMQKFPRMPVDAVGKQNKFMSKMLWVSPLWLISVNFSNCLKRCHKIYHHIGGSVLLHWGLMPQTSFFCVKCSEMFLGYSLFCYSSRYQKLPKNGWAETVFMVHSSQVGSSFLPSLQCRIVYSIHSELSFSMW